MNTTEFQVTGMTCGHCEMSVREEVQEVSGVESIQVSHQDGKLVVTGAEPVDEAAVLSAVEEAGYQAVRQASSRARAVSALRVRHGGTVPGR